MELQTKPIKVEVLTGDQLTSRRESDRHTLEIINNEQERSIPDKIDGRQLSYEDKVTLLTDQLEVPELNESYTVNAEGNIKRGNGTLVNSGDIEYGMRKDVNEENFDYLKNSMKYLGFGENLKEALKGQMMRGEDRFTIGATASFEVGKEKERVDYELEFSKSSQGKYFLNGYRATLNEGDRSVERRFAIGKGNDITAKEAYNLLSGRSILKRAQVPERFRLMAGDEQVQILKNVPEGRAAVKERIAGGEARRLSIENNKGVTIAEFDKAGRQLKTKRDVLFLEHMVEGKGKVIQTPEDVKRAREFVDAEKGMEGYKGAVLKDNNTAILEFDSKGNERDVTPATREEEIWIKLDFDQTDKHGQYPMRSFYKNYGFDLKTELEKLPIKELNNRDQLERLVQSLEKGNKQAVTLKTEKGEEKGYIAASPQYKSIDKWDSDMKYVYPREANPEQTITAIKADKVSEESEVSSRGVKR